MLQPCKVMAMMMMMMMMMMMRMMTMVSEEKFRQTQDFQQPWKNMFTSAMHTCIHIEHGLGGLLPSPPLAPLETKGRLGGVSWPRGSWHK